MSEISNGATDDIVLKIESIDFDQKDKHDIEKTIQKEIEKFCNELQFCRNLKGKIIVLFAFNIIFNLLLGSVLQEHLFRMRKVRCLNAIVD